MGKMNIQSLCIQGLDSWPGSIQDFNSALGAHGETFQLCLAGNAILAREMQNVFCKEASVVADALQDFVF